MSIREAVEAAVNTVEEKQSATPAPAAPSPAVSAPETPVKTDAEETEAQKLGRTAGRPRDEHGRLLPGKPDKPAASAAPVAAPVLAQEPRSGVARPSSWKKDHWEAFDKIAAENPALAEYLNQRESEFAKGVSTYKQEYENVRPLADAMQPLLPILQQYGIQPAQWINQMGQAHHSLLFGTPQQKLQMFAKLAQDYQVPLQALYDPQMQQQFLMQQSLQPAPQVQQPDVRAAVQEQLSEVFAKQDLERFQTEKDVSGSPLYPHYDEVRNTMAQLLEAGVAQDLKSAYETALIAPQHRHLWEAEQQAKQAAAQKAAQEAQAKATAKAKATAVSTRTSTPAGEATATKPKGIRANVEAAFDAVTSQGGRV